MVTQLLACMGTATPDRLGASMVREPTVGVPDGASAEWDMADYAAVGRDEPLKEAAARRPPLGLP